MAGDIFVTVPGLAEWAAAQAEAEQGRRARFTQRVKAREQQIKLAELRHIHPIPEPLQCDRCRRDLRSTQHGIETPAMRLICKQCRVGVRA
jgi:hypothetical protein